MRGHRTIVPVVAAFLVVAALVVGGCSTTAKATQEPASQTTTLTLQSNNSYTPSVPAGGGTDDYHCTLLDPQVTVNSYIVSSQFFPEIKTTEVHHAILFLVPPDLADQARQADQNGRGWSCFGETPLPGSSVAQISNTPWLTAWGPGHGLDVLPNGTGVQLQKGSLVVMQIHYNMLAGDKPVRAKLVLHTVPATAHLKPMHLDLLPAPPDIPCPTGVTGPLCARAASLADTGQRFGQSEIGFVNLIERVCGRSPTNPPAGDTTACTWGIPAGHLVRLTAHMHLLGRGMKIVLDPGTPKARTLLNVTNYDFDYQRSYNLAKPVAVTAGDHLQVTCTFNPHLRQELPELRRLPPRFVTWGDGSSDEMCLAIVQYVGGSAPSI
jgi:Copper type II ascorbate-dependent monooxygenase, C-terminal domain